MKTYPQYKCIQTVKALQINSLYVSGGVVILEPVELGFDHIQLPHDYIIRHTPINGGYYVEYQDGSTSYCDREHFNKFYTLIDDPVTKCNTGEWVHVESASRKLVGLPKPDTPILFMYGASQYYGYFQDHDEEDYGFYIKGYNGDDNFVEADNIMKWRYV